MWRAVALALVLQAGVGLQASAQQATSNDEQVQVIAPHETLEQTTRAITSELTQAVPPYWQAPSWRRTVCPGVTGLQRDAAQVVIDRIAATAQYLNLRVGEPGCRANVLVIFTDDPSAVVAQADRVKLTTFGVGDNAGQERRERGFVSTRGRAGWRDFTQTDRPVRWWNIAQLMNSDGIAIGAQTAMTDGGRLHQPTRLDLIGSFVIVDTRRVGGVRFGPMADYLTMVALAQINPDADMSRFSSILNLFSDDEALRVQELTPWDLAYLQGLYATDASARTSQVQEREIAHRMADQLQ